MLFRELSCMCVRVLVCECLHMYLPVCVNVECVYIYACVCVRACMHERAYVRTSFWNLSASRYPVYPAPVPPTGHTCVYVWVSIMHIYIRGLWFILKNINTRDWYDDWLALPLIKDINTRWNEEHHQQKQKQTTTVVMGWLLQGPPFPLVPISLIF